MSTNPTTSDYRIEYQSSKDSSIGLPVFRFFYNNELVASAFKKPDKWVWRVYHNNALGETGYAAQGENTADWAAIQSVMAELTPRYSYLIGCSRQANLQIWEQNREGFAEASRQSASVMASGQFDLACQLRAWAEQQNCYAAAIAKWLDAQ